MTVVSVEELSKAYRLGVIGTGTLTNDLQVWWAKARGKPNPLLKIGQKEHGNRDGETIWALKDVSFEVKQGEVLGIIGRNGAGKSTLLKILSQITAPTEGRVKIKGRIASLLEVGTGFHPELTGRENVYLNGAILGMKKAEIARKFEEIVAFAETEQFIDTPVKRYSSGMYVRLAFAVAAHLDPEILLVDEVLAVGDAAFQKKCLGKMEDVAQGGRTVLFVSHNMGAIGALCRSAVWIDGGRVVKQGSSESVVGGYLSSASVLKSEWRSDDLQLEKKAQVVSTRICTPNGKSLRAAGFMEPFAVEILYRVREPLLGCTASVHLLNAQGVSVFQSKERDSTDWESRRRSVGRYCSRCHVLPGILRPGTYFVNVAILRENFEFYDQQKNIISFEVLPYGSPVHDGRKGVISPVLKWEVEEDRS